MREFKLRPIADAQEMVAGSGGVNYWEGACDVLESGELIGRAYLELTGYAGDVASRLR